MGKRDIIRSKIKAEEAALEHWVSANDRFRSQRNEVLIKQAKKDIKTLRKTEIDLREKAEDLVRERVAAGHAEKAVD